MTQKARTLKALRDSGHRGITQVDFQPGRVIDNGLPITRLAARVDELKADGHVIATAGRRHGCVVYVLAREAPGVPGAVEDHAERHTSPALAETPTSAAPGTAETLFEVPPRQPGFDDIAPPRSAVHGWDNEAA